MPSLHLPSPGYMWKTYLLELIAGVLPNGVLFMISKVDGGYRL